MAPITVNSNIVTIQVSGTSSGYILSVFVYDTNSGSGIASASVSVSGPSKVSGTTDSTGNVTFTGLSSGQYTITASKANYTTTSMNVNLTGNYALRIGLKYSGTSGNYLLTYNASASPINGGTVAPGTVSNASSATFTATPYGNYMFSSWSIVYNSTVLASAMIDNPITLISDDICKTYNVPNGATINVIAHFLPRNILTVY